MCKSQLGKATVIGQTVQSRNDKEIMPSYCRQERVKTMADETGNGPFSLVRKKSHHASEGFIYKCENKLFIVAISLD